MSGTGENINFDEKREAQYCRGFFKVCDYNLTLSMHEHSLKTGRNLKLRFFFTIVFNMWSPL